MIRKLLIVSTFALAATAQAGNIPVVSPEGSAVSIVIPPVQTTGGAPAAVTPSSAPSLSTLLGGGGSGTPVSIQGTPAQMQALTEFANNMAPGPVRAAVRRALGLE